MSKFQEERDAAAEARWMNHSCETRNCSGCCENYLRPNFEAGFNACLESSVARELVESITNLLERSRERADDHEFPKGDGYYDWADKCHQLLATYSEALAEIRGEK